MVNSNMNSHLNSNLNPNLNFSGQRLRNRSFRGQDLSGANFNGCDLRGCDFRGAQLTGAVLDGARLGVSPERLGLGLALGLALGGITLHAVSLLGFAVLGVVPGHKAYGYALALYGVLGVLGLVPLGLAAWGRERWGLLLSASLTGMLWGFCYGGLASGDNARLALGAMGLGGAVGLLGGAIVRQPWIRGSLWGATAVGAYGFAFLINAQTMALLSSGDWGRGIWGLGGVLLYGGLTLGALRLGVAGILTGARSSFWGATVAGTSWRGIGRSQLDRCFVAVADLGSDDDRG